MALQRPIVAFSHLRWDFVFQRPQQLLSRLAVSHRVLYVEEPVDGGGQPDGWDLSEPASDVLVARPRIANLAGRAPEEMAAATSELLRDLVASQEIEQPIAWLYTPMAMPLLPAIEPSLVVYDCMDELSLFAGAPAQLVAREAELFAEADLVFTGGVSLYEAKRHHHPRVFCFPSSVDRRHFGRARRGESELVEPADQVALPAPRLGFFGVIDERLDPSLIEALAESHPDWQIVMVGPVVKIDTGTLPMAANIHYMGQRGYDELPGFLSGWDVCLLPFARNDATRFISPTKTLEYMAAERPIVSTPIADVAGPFKHIVYLAESAEEFVHAAERALSASPAEREQRAAGMRAVLDGTSWDATVSRMQQLLAEAATPSLAKRT